MKFSCFSIFLITFAAVVYGHNIEEFPIFGSQDYAAEKISRDWPFEDNVDKRPFLTRDCFRPVDGSPKPIMCMAAISAWSFDMKSKSCKSTVYGGCNPTKNLFYTKAQCEEVAKPVCKKLLHILENVDLINILDILIYKVQD
ncbi:unnamed protein product [Diabrotica balteata]|uniref:BPTI/Kunitz inhibitor domain-containing protein n=1 Tax=Diabrotica balteata TaxID=107213 RepID=A0A9N9XE19_DIABA|nr:unnamed protein product [Diabrotica balteata]